MESIHPLTIVGDRYGGGYSGAKFTAWNAEFYDVPKEIDGGDVDCVTFWSEFARGEQRYLVGFGKTPNEACNDLSERIRRFEVAFNIRTYEICDLSDEMWRAFIKDERPKTKLWLGFDVDSKD